MTYQIHVRKQFGLPHDGEWMTNLHCSGGAEMMLAVREMLEVRRTAPF